MLFNENQKATYLFCAKLTNAKTLPLTIMEWNELIRALKQNNLEPKDILKMTPSEILRIGSSTQKMMKILKKIESRQKLGFSMMELEELTNKGYKIMFRQNMPRRLKRKLDPKYLPPFFYFVGDTSIFEYYSLGVVGSRDATEEDIANTADLGHKAAIHGVAIVSGGARGIDHTAVDSCLKNGGKAIIFPSDGLESWIKQKEIRHYIQNKQLLLISAQPINSRFTGFYAMQRNKYIHTTAHAVMVASSKIFAQGKKTKTGTWSGVLENIAGQWSPLFVQGKSEGVQKLLEEGYAKRFDSFDNLLITMKNSQKISELANVNDVPFPRKEILRCLEIAKKSGWNEQQIRNELTSLLREVFDSLVQNDNSNERSEEVKQLENKIRMKENMSLNEGINNESIKDKTKTSSGQMSIVDLLPQEDD